MWDARSGSARRESRSIIAKNARLGENMGDRAPRRRHIGAALLLTVALSSAGVATAGPASGGTQGNILGSKDRARGAPVKIGYVTNDKSPTVDNSIETPVANATAEWLNGYKSGVGGHPIELVRCVDLATPSKATDCANQLIQEDVAAVVIGSNGSLENIWTPVHTAGIPMFLYGASNPAVSTDAASTFLMTNGTSSLLEFPAGLAEKSKAKKVSIVAIDVPSATSYFKGPAPALYQKRGLDLELIAIAPGTADMTPQMQRLTTDNPKGVAMVLGNEPFCIAAFNGLRTAGFKGTVATLPYCITDATRTAVPADFLKGVEISASAPIGDPKNPSTKLYRAVLKKGGAGDVDTTQAAGLSMFIVLSGLSVATQDLDGEPSPASIVAAAKSMPWSELPGTGGTHFRCGGMADPNQPAVCTNATLAATLNGKGEITKYRPLGDAPIGSTAR